MNKETVYRMLEKLRSFAERDCGAESDNAIRKIEKWKKEYNITDFYYIPYYQKKTRDNITVRSYYKISYTTLMRDVVLHLARKCGYTVVCQRGKKYKLYLYVTEKENQIFKNLLKRTKKLWKRNISIVNEQTCDEIDDIFNYADRI